MNEIRNLARAMPSLEALFRFLVVSIVLGFEARGARRSEAVAQVTAHAHFDHRKGRLREVKQRTLYRWIAAYETAVAPVRAGQLDTAIEARAIAALEPARRKATESSLVLPEVFLIYVKDQKQQDPEASVPELIRRAVQEGIIASAKLVSRQTVFRALRRMGFSMRRRRKARDRDSRRFAYPHRMQCVLCDGKHFRAGPKRRRRVALFFIDDSSRYVLHVVVGTSENKRLFLRGLYELSRKYGFADLYYLDRGPGFIAAETIVIVGRISHLIHGEAGYSEGRGKVERFNRTVNAALLRALDGHPEVDADCAALEHRLLHYCEVVYNHQPHEALGGKTPYEVFHSDERSLRIPEDDQQLRDMFVIYLERRVANDHVVPVDSKHYEVPRGYAGQKVVLHRKMYDDTVHLLHDGKFIELKEVDKATNARGRRASRKAKEQLEPPTIVTTAAQMAYRKDFEPIVDSDGGYTTTRKDSK